MSSTTLTRMFDGRTTGRRRERIRRYAACRGLIYAVALLVVAVVVVGTPMMHGMAHIALLTVAGIGALSITPVRRVIAAPVAVCRVAAVAATVAAMPAELARAARAIVADIRRMLRAARVLPRAALDATRDALGVVCATIQPRTTSNSLSPAA